MRTPTKFVEELIVEQKSRLQAIMKSNASQRQRMRAHAVLLSARRFSIDQIAAIYEVDRDRVSQWLEWWKEFEFEGLADKARQGRPPRIIFRRAGASRKDCRRRAAQHSTCGGGDCQAIKKKVSRRTLKRLLRAGRQKWRAGAAEFEKAAR